MDKKVKYFDYPVQFKVHEKEYMEIIRETLSRGAYILCEDLKRFEENLAKFVGTKYAIGVGNCTDALLLSLYAAGIGPGDEVITVSHTFVATVEVIKFLGAKPVFVDITDDHNMHVELVEPLINSKTKAIVPVHLNGHICKDMDKLMAIAKKHKLIIIEDAAQSLGATYKGKGAGTFGLSGCFSFYPAKLLGAFGDAGAIVTDDAEFAEKLRMIRNHGRGKGTDIGLWGLNCRMDNVHAAVLDLKLKKLPDWIKRRREIANMYNSRLSSLKELRLPPPPEENGDYYDVFQNYELEAERRDALVKHLNENGIEAMLSWGGKGVHQFNALGLNNFKLPRTEEFFSKAIMLPMYPELKDEQIRYIVQAIKDFYAKR
ncbi:MAG TPA: DegT/DnrJ/EryC1/StrS family aminotransferase [Candidatus Brocadiia bacterium]|nr:DegT/DnrJ/EryC1/StrS family aminotransferase [Planctomycetota bacterium]MDO8091989.1 DegT/DnrJ/EryC1/StrS family aminotransferase [Candidatus Brocadiales bacterium]